MIPYVPGYETYPIALVNSPSELNIITTQEEALPQSTRIILEVHVDPSEDIISIAQAVQDSCVQNGVPYWPEYPNTYAFVEGNTLYITYVKPAGAISPSIGIIAIIGIILFIAPIIMLITGAPLITGIINNVVNIIMLVMMMKMMTPMMNSMSEPSRQKQVPASSGGARPQSMPFEQRVSRRLESIADSVDRTERSFEKSKGAGISALSSVVKDITNLVGAIKGKPGTALSSYKKGQVAREIDSLDNRLERYQDELTGAQLEQWNVEQLMVDELRETYG